MEYILTIAASFLALGCILGLRELARFLLYICLSLVELALVGLCLFIFHNQACLLLLLVFPAFFLFLGRKRGIIAISTNIGLKISIISSCWITIQYGLSQVPDGLSALSAWLESSKFGCASMGPALTKFIEVCGQCHIDDIVLPALTTIFFLASSWIVKQKKYS